MCSGKGVCYLEGFSGAQKVLMRICLYGFFSVGMLGVFLESMLFGVLYLICMGLMAWVVLRCFCSHCPYPYTSKTCLAMPYQIVTLWPFRDRKLSRIEKTLFIGMLTVVVLFPQYFLWQRLPLFVVYWMFCLPTCVVFPAYFCRHCRFVNCPFNPDFSQTS
jgi:hypothetical protein